MTSERDFLTVREVTNRGLNFFGVAVLGLLTTSVIHGLQLARSWSDRADDLALAAVALGAVAWYLAGRNRYRRSLVPLVGLVLGVVVKLAGLWLLYGRLVLAGADFGVAIFLTVAALIYLWQYYQLRERRHGKER